MAQHVVLQAVVPPVLTLQTALGCRRAPAVLAAPGQLQLLHRTLLTASRPWLQATLPGQAVRIISSNSSSSSTDSSVRQWTFCPLLQAPVNPALTAQGPAAVAMDS